MATQGVWEPIENVDQTIYHGIGYDALYGTVGEVTRSGWGKNLFIFVGPQGDDCLITHYMPLPCQPEDTH